MQITQAEFHAIYGAGRPAMPGWSEAYADPHVTPENDVRVLSALIDFTKSKRCLEIGCNNGATSVALLKGNTVITQYVGVDLPKIWFHNQLAGHFALNDPRFKPLQFENGSLSLNAVDIGMFDFVLIDGNHTEPYIQRDTELAYEIISPGGVIAWHDYMHPKESLQVVTRFVDELKVAQAPISPIIWVEGTVVCYQIMP